MVGTGHGARVGNPRRTAARRLLLLAALAVMPAAGAAQAAPDTLVPAGAEYRFHGFFGGFNSWLYGSRYRALWATPVAAPLAPLAPPRGDSAWAQDTTLHFDGYWLWTPEGAAWVYRPLDRDLLSGTTPLVRRQLLPTVIQGLNPARHPGAPPVVAVLARAAGAAVPATSLARIAFDLPIPEGDGRLGYLEEATAAGPTTGDLLDTLRLDGGRRLDTRAYLRERLFDIYVGSWDDVPEEWSWERTDSGAWAPAPRRRDKAFARFDGVLAGWVRNAVPGFVRYGPAYDADLGLMPFQRTLDRQLLAPLDWAAWDSSAAAMQRALTDSVLDAAVAALPAEYREAAADPLRTGLRARRDRLPEAARRLYHLVNQEAALFGTPGADTVTVTRGEDGGMEVRVAGGIRRTWGPGETDAVALYLLGGADRLELVGPGRDGPRLDVAWQEGLTVGGTRQSGLLTTLYGGAPKFPRLGLEYVPDTLPVPEAEDLDPTRPPPLPLHGTEARPIPWIDINSDVGILLGGGVELTTYLLGHEPFYRRATIRSGYATATDNYAIEFHSEFRRWRSPVIMTVDAGLSEIAVLHFFGYGNETPFTETASFYLAQQRQLYLYPAWNYQIGPRSHLAIGPSFKHVRTDTLTTSYINLTRPYGTPEFAQAGVLASAVYDTRDAERFTRHGLAITASGSYYPFLFGSGTPFGTMSASIASYVTPSALPVLTIATRLSGRLGMGDVPVHEAAFAGGSRSIRGYESNRYAGQAALYFNGELRLRAGTLPFVVPWQFGVVGIGDVGRVFNDDEESGAWHGAAGGGLWIAMPDRSLGAVFTMVHSPQGTSLWLSYQFMY